MKYLSIMAVLMALSASQLLAQKTAAESPAIIPLPLNSQACGNVDVPAPTATARTLKQAMPSPELRSYVRLLICNILTDISSNADLLQSSIVTLDDVQKYLKSCIGLALNAYKETSQSGLMADEKAFVEELNTLLPELYASLMDSDMNDEEAGNKMEMQIQTHMVILSQKYPTVIACFSGELGLANFFDMKKLQDCFENLENEIECEADGKHHPQLAFKFFAKIAEMIRNNEI